MEDPKPIGRRARNRAARAAFAAARNRGLVLRHRNKLQHLAEKGLYSTQTPEDVHNVETPEGSPKEVDP